MEIIFNMNVLYPKDLKMDHLHCKECEEVSDKFIQFEEEFIFICEKCIRKALKMFEEVE